MSNRISYPCLLLLLALMPYTRVSAEIWQQLSQQIKLDHQNYYQAENIRQLALVSLGAALLANTDLDADLRTKFKHHLAAEDDTDVYDIGTRIGEAGQLFIAVPLYLGAYVLAENIHFTGSDGLGNWGNQALRAAILAAPQHLILGALTGAQRPTEGGSDWSLLNDNNGVSGHALYGALPLLTLANSTDNKWLRRSYVLASTIPGLARINDDKHYGSQVVLGWSLAYLSATAVFATDTKKQSLILPMPVNDGLGVSLYQRF